MSLGTRRSMKQRASACICDSDRDSRHSHNQHLFSRVDFYNLLHELKLKTAQVLSMFPKISERMPRPYMVAMILNWLRLGALFRDRGPPPSLVALAARVYKVYIS